MLRPANMLGNRPPTRRGSCGVRELACPACPDAGRERLAAAGESRGDNPRLRNGFVGAQHAAPGKLAWRDAAPSATPTGDHVSSVGATPLESAIVQGALVESTVAEAGAGQESSSETGKELSKDCQVSAPGAACCAPTAETSRYLVGRTFRCDISG